MKKVFLILGLSSLFLFGDCDSEFKHMIKSVGTRYQDITYNEFLICVEPGCYNINKEYLFLEGCAEPSYLITGLETVKSKIDAIIVDFKAKRNRKKK